MRVQKGKRGYYYRCDDCFYTENEPKPASSCEIPVLTEAMMARYK